MTPEERAVLEAALESCDVYDDPRAQARWAFDAGEKMRSAVRAYRESMKPKPRYIVQGSYVLDSHSTPDVYPASCPSEEWAERICRLLNEAENG